MLGSRVVYICDKAVQTDRESIDRQKSFYLDYYTCKEYNKKLVKKLHQANMINNDLKNKLDDLKISFDDGLNRNKNEISNMNKAENEPMQSRLLNHNLVNELGRANDKEQIRQIGNQILNQMDRLLEKSENFRIKKDKMLDLMSNFKTDENGHNKDTCKVVYEEFV